ncbi:MAG: DUF177 domain-containing protein [Chlamydiota bacterium]|nr:DUF177 domain-containing protein [Chlamydiota bacterium]
MLINIKQIPEGGLCIEHAEPTGGMGLNDERVHFDEHIFVRVKAYCFNDRLYVIGSINTNVSLECGRCLEKFSQLIGSEDFSCDYEILTDDVIDLTDRIREDIIVALPIQPLCQSDCRGLCKQCGNDLNKGDCACKKEQEEVRSPFEMLKKFKIQD